MAKHVFNTFFSDTSNPLVSHHLDSYADLLDTKLPEFLKASNPQHLVLTDERFVDVYVGGRDGDKITYHPPTDELGNAILPHMCRLENKTYALDVRADIDIVYTISGRQEVRSFTSVLIGRMPLMVRSKLCYLHTMTQDQLYEAGECKFELGGYFIISGAEKVLLTQERLGNNMLYASQRRSASQPNTAKRTLVEKEEASKLADSTEGEKFEYIAGIRSASEDGTKGPYSHFLVIPPANKDVNDPKILSSMPDFSEFVTNRLAVITLPGFTQPVPLFSVFYALGLTSDKDIYETILAGLPDEDKGKYDSLFAALVFSHEKFLQQEMKKEQDQEQEQAQGQGQGQGQG